MYAAILCRDAIASTNSPVVGPEGLLQCGLVSEVPPRDRVLDEIRLVEEPGHNRVHMLLASFGLLSSKGKVVWAKLYKH